jgi:hypothetical protein
MAKRKGRRAGSRNRGYFYRTGRGWFAKIAVHDKDGDVKEKFVALEFENGDRMRDRYTPAAELKAAADRAHE